MRSPVLLVGSRRLRRQATPTDYLRGWIDPGGSGSLHLDSIRLQLILRRASLHRPLSRPFLNMQWSEESYSRFTSGANLDDYFWTLSSASSSSPIVSIALITRSCNRSIAARTVGGSPLQTEESWERRSTLVEWPVADITTGCGM